MAKGCREGRRRTAIVGVGSTEFSRNSGKSETQLAVQAIQAAMADSGLDLRSIDGFARYSADSTTEATLVNVLGLPHIRFLAELSYGGTAAAGCIALAHAAIAAGQVDCIVCYRAMNGRSGTRFGRGERMLREEGPQRAHASGQRTFGSALTAPWGLLSPSQLMGMWAHRYAHETGISHDTLTQALAAVAITQRDYARNNPNAVLRDKPLTLGTYLGSRMIATPLRVPDFCPEIDGAVAIVVASMELALDTARKPVQILGADQFLFRHGDTPSLYAERLDRLVPPDARRIFDKAGVAPGDVDVAAFYDATSIMVPMALEDYGFCERGAAASFILEGNTLLGGRLPTNTHGGMLAEGYLHGLNNLPEIVHQLRGESVNQVPGARVGFFSAGYGSVLLGAA